MTLPTGYKDPRWIPIWLLERALRDAQDSLGNYISAPARVAHSIVSWKPTYDKPGSFDYLVTVLDCGHEQGKIGRKPACSVREGS